MGEAIGKLGLATLFVMEGGYAVEEIGINAVNVLQGFEGFTGKPARNFARSERETARLSSGRRAVSIQGLT